MIVDENVKEISHLETEFNNPDLVAVSSCDQISTPSKQNLAIPSSFYPNPVLAAADPLLHKMGSMTQKTFSTFTQEELNKEVKNFEKTLRQWRYPNDKIVLSSQVLQTYIQLCTHKLMGKPIEFRTVHIHPLLSHLEKLAKKAHQYIDVLELFYLCLNLDLQAAEKEDKTWQMLLQKIYQFIYTERGEMERKLSVDLVPPRSVHTPRSLTFSFFKMTCVVVVILLGIYGASFYLLNTYSDHFSQELEVIDQHLESMK